VGVRKDVTLTIRLTPRVRRALSDAARKDLRPTSQFLIKTLVDRLRLDRLITAADAEEALLRAPRSDRGRRRRHERRPTTSQSKKRRGS
jgi:hypothetical protein